MLNKLLRNLMAPKVIPIGLDLGSEWLRMAQVQVGEGGAKLIAAAEMRVPESAKTDQKSRLEFLVEGSRQLLARGFQGRQVVLGLSPSMIYAQHLRLPKMDEKELRKAVPWEARGKLPIEPQKAMLRYVIAGEVYRDREPGEEIVVLASNKELVQHYLRTAERAKIDVVGMEPDPLTINACLAPLYGKGEAEAAVMFVDIGAESCRAIVNEGQHLRFVRFIAVGAEGLARAEREGEETASPAGMGAATATATVASGARQKLDALVEELELCRRYYEATFPNKPIERLVFVGGGAAQRNWCQYIARRMNIAAQVGDPLQRVSKAGAERVGDVDLRQSGHSWTVALGLSLKCQEEQVRSKA